MGEDMHCKWYIKSKVGEKAGKYISAMEVMPTFDTSESNDFQDVFSFRSYPFFSMMGSSRSDWRMLENVNEGFPEWHAVEFPTENAMLKLKCHNYYRYGWMTFKDFRKALQDRIVELGDVNLYYRNDPSVDISEPILDLLQNYSKSDEAKSFVKNFDEEAGHLIDICKEIIEKLDKIAENYGDQDFRPLFDIEDSIMLFWFDC